MFIRRLIGKKFKETDYNLNLNDRKAKYENYDIIFCEKCKKQFEQDLFYCKNCCNKEINEEKRNCMLYGECEGCSRTCTDYDWCSYCGFQSNGIMNKQIVF